MSVIAIRSALPLRLRRGLVLGQVGMSLHHKLCHVLCGTTTCRDRLHITSRKVIGLFLEQLRLQFVPVLHRLQGRLAAEG